MNSRTWTDEQLSAFLDGELNTADTEALARAVETDTVLSARLERLGAANRAFVAAASEIDRQPMSDGLKAVMAAPPTAKVLPFRAKTPVASVAAFVSEHRAIAAGLIVAAAAWGASSSFGPTAPVNLSTPGPDGYIAASSPLYNALEKGRTSEAVFVADNTSVTPRLTFASASGGFCRQYDVASGEGVTTAIACREDGKWRTEIAVFGKPSPGSDFQTASSDKSPALEAFIDQHISGAPLTAAEETAAIGKGWK